MLFMVGIEVHKNNEEAWGIIVPVFERFGLGCISAVDNEEDILTEASAVILSMLEIALEEGISLSDLTEPYTDYTQDKNLEAYNRWIGLDVDLSSLSNKSSQLSINLPSSLLTRIDDLVATNQGVYKDREEFLAIAAFNEIKNHYPA